MLTMSKRLRRSAACAVLLLALPQWALGESAKSYIRFKEEYFWDRNGVWNHTPAFMAKLIFAKGWSLGWSQELDFVSGASRYIGAGATGNKIPDAVSGASKSELRHSEHPSLNYHDKGLNAAASVYSSRENDYFSWSPSVSMSVDFNDRNTTLGGDYAIFFDEFRPAGPFAGQGGNKRVRSGSVTLSQTFSPVTLVGLTASFSNSEGYLGHPYTPPVDRAGHLLMESVPDHKFGEALSGQIVQGWHLGDLLGSLNLDGRGYADDWGLRSGTIDARVSQYFADGAFIQLEGRYYAQDGADFAKEFYTGPEAYRSADVRWYPFSSWLAGFKISTAFPEAWQDSPFLPDRWDFKYDQLMRDTRGDQRGAGPGEPRRTLYQLYAPDEYYLQGVAMFGLQFNL
jgi:hypothetical protein